MKQESAAHVSALAALHDTGLLCLGHRLSLFMFESPGPKTVHGTQ